jgi:hypothetical protein
MHYRRILVVIPRPQLKELAKTLYEYLGYQLLVMVSSVRTRPSAIICEEMVGRKATTHPRNVMSRKREKALSRMKNSAIYNLKLQFRVVKVGIISCSTMYSIGTISILLLEAMHGGASGG